MLRKSGDIMIVTAADFTHEKSLMQLLNSIEFSLPGARVMIWDLGLTHQAKEQVKARFEASELYQFDFSSKPKHFEMTSNSGSYAWKPWCLMESLEKRNSERFMYWMDAGCTISPLARLIKKVACLSGVYLGPSMGTIGEWTHPKSLQIIRSDYSLSDSSLDLLCSRRNFSAAFIAFDLQNTLSMKVLSTWASLALKKEVIAPEGSTKENHRFDQAILNILLSLFRRAPGLLISNFLIRIPIQLFGIKIHQDIDS